MKKLIRMLFPLRLFGRTRDGRWMPLPPPPSLSAFDARLGCGVPGSLWRFKGLLLLAGPFVVRRVRMARPQPTRIINDLVPDPAWGIADLPGGFGHLRAQAATVAAASQPAGSGEYVARPLQRTPTLECLES